MGEKKCIAISMERFNGGVAIKRRYGSSTVTRFAVQYADKSHAERIVTAYGKTPGERRTFAIEEYRRNVEAGVW